MTKKSTVSSRIKQIRNLQEVDVPWDVRRAFDHFSIQGDQIAFSKDGDYLTLEEAQEVVKWLLEQIGTGDLDKS